VESGLMWLWQTGSAAADHWCCPNAAVADCQMQGVITASAQKVDYCHCDILTTRAHALISFITYGLMWRWQTMTSQGDIVCH